MFLLSVDYFYSVTLRSKFNINVMLSVAKSVWRRSLLDPLYKFWSQIESSIALKTISVNLQREDSQLTVNVDSVFNLLSS